MAFYRLNNVRGAKERPVTIKYLKDTLHSKCLMAKVRPAHYPLYLVTTYHPHTPSPSWHCFVGPDGKGGLRITLPRHARTHARMHCRMQVVPTPAALYSLGREGVLLAGGMCVAARLWYV